MPAVGGDVRPMPASGGGALDYGTGPRSADGFAPETDDPTDGRGFFAPGAPQLRSVPDPADGDPGDSGGPPASAPRLRAVPGSGGPEPVEAGTDGHGFPPPGPPRLRVVPPLAEAADPADRPKFAPPGGSGSADHATDGRESAAHAGPGGRQDAAGNAIDARGFTPLGGPRGQNDGGGHNTGGSGFTPTGGPRAQHDGAGPAADGPGFDPQGRPPGHQDGSGHAKDGRGFRPPAGRDEGAGYTSDGRGFAPLVALPGRNDGAGYATDGQGFAPPGGSVDYDDDDQYVTDGFGFAAMPGARAGEPLGDGFVYVVPMGNQPAAGEGYRPPDQRQPPAEPGRPGEFGFPVGRADRAEHPAAGDGFNTAWPVGQPAPSQGGERFTGRAGAGGALTGGTAEMPAVPERAPHEPAAGRMRDDDGGIT
jgi:hypothetical protein